MPSMLSRCLGIAAAATLLAAAGPVLAHAALKTSMPAAGASVAAPRQLSLRFNETLEPKFSSAEVAGPGGRRVKARVHVGMPDAKSIMVVPAARLKAGAYAVKWRAVGGDGHRITGDYRFTVR